MHVRLVHFRCKIHLDLPVLGTDTGLSSNLLHLLTLSLTHVVENGSLEFVSEFDDDSGWAAIGCARACLLLAEGQGTSFLRCWLETKCTKVVRLEFGGVTW